MTVAQGAERARFVVTIDRVDPRATALAVSCLAAVACGERARSEPAASAPTAAATAGPSDGSKAAPSALAAPVRSAAATAGASTSAASSTASGAPVASAAASARSATTGANDCKLVRGPVRLSVTGAVAIGPGEGGLLAFATNKVGAPAWEMPRFPEPAKPGSTSLVPRTPARVPLVPGPLASSPLPAAASTGAPAGGTSASASASAGAGAPPEDRTRLPACALAAGLAFCVDAEGQIHRRPVVGGEDKVIAKGRRGTAVSAVAALGHTFYAFLANQKTTEGVTVRAFASFDDETPIPLSEEGSGATFVALVARDDDVLAMYIDARTALTPVHARALRVDGTSLTRGKDAVVLVGGGSDSVVRGAVGRAASGPAFLFAPLARDGSEYGLSAVSVSGEPKDDMDARWSLYPAGMTYPPIAATTGVSPLRLVRVRPETKDEGAPSVLELGHVEADGTFRDRCLLAKGSGFSDVSIAVDAQENLWVAYTSSTGTWVEQRGPGGK